MTTHALCGAHLCDVAEVLGFERPGELRAREPRGGGREVREIPMGDLLETGGRRSYPLKQGDILRLHNRSSGALKVRVETRNGTSIAYELVIGSCVEIVAGRDAEELNVSLEAQEFSGLELVKEGPDQ